MKQISFTESIRNSLENNLNIDPNIFIIGLGADYPNGADGTHKGLSNIFPGRLIDTPTSEAALTGLAVGAAAAGLRPIVHHGRVEFALFAADQIFTQAAKWNSMFGNNYACPLFLRICIGRQWGNGPQHTQSLLGLFGNSIGIEVIIPYDPQSASDFISYQRNINHPVIFLESRWLYKTNQIVNIRNVKNIEGVDIIKSAGDIACICIGEGVQEALATNKLINEQYVNDCLAVIAVTKINPFPVEALFEKVKNYKALIIFDTYNAPFGFAHETFYAIRSNNKEIKIEIITTKHANTPISPLKAASFYPTKISIINKYLELKNIKNEIKEKRTIRELSLPPEFEFETRK